MNKSVIFGIVGLVIGVILTGSVATYAVNGKHTGVMRAYAMNTDMMTQRIFPSPTDANNMSMSDMSVSLKGKTGNDFDKAFVSEMITHHQGAIDMANLALANAKHQEVKDLAKNIVTAQTSEINQMQMWQSQWGYTSSNNSSMPGMKM